MTAIDWERISEPQSDGYDVGILKALLKETKQYEKPANNGGFLKSVALIDYDGSYNPGKQAPAIENIRKVESKMAIWPELIHSYEELVDYVIFAHEDEERSWNKTYGCSCGHTFFNYSSLNGKIGVFVGMLGTLGTLEALAHEVGHLRLRMAGIHIEDHDSRLILNSPTELFDSPIRKDMKRPMSAVLQAQYSYVMVSDTDLKYYDAHPDDDEKQQCAVQYLKMNIPRISKGHDEVKNNIKVTAEGQKFMDGFWAYSDKVINRGLKLMG